ncbi:hypothetical protein SteCoe_22138 [Stentor coeruleus]|uniref:C2H2-type domain-containing protein n=1 Tax=Stentor coeruleus TaxID=5963 RepID=A0A1R2BN48_9CILI|nr:hypothetical protein SteCoe_22138 [Stentor coeruleus]
MKIKRFYCSIEGCNKSFRSEEQLISHTHSHSVQEVSQEEHLRFQCEICLTQFPTKRSVSAHKRIHKSAERASYTKKIINILTDRLILLSHDLQIPNGPYTIEDIKLPPITFPSSAILPTYYSLFTK